ncbi:tyrosine-type recombinase/integrase [Nonomuraea sp. NPDC050022]|uniref:tyrosine-type recombinase/integrase n=1 Tax=Nonomuraea sp. NPDC050022 TaxID=3364358 RepID=UPI0037A68BE3
MRERHDRSNRRQNGGRPSAHTPTTTSGKDFLASAGLKDGRLHDARHTAATVLLILGVPERTVMAIMGWSSSGMARWYQHVTDGIRNTVEKQVDGLLWEGDKSSAEAN